MSLKLVIMLGALATPACWIASRPCTDVDRQGPGLSGTLAYTAADGARVEATLARSSISITTPGAVTILGRFDDPLAGERQYEVHVRGLVPGSVGASVLGDLCMKRQTGGEIICSGLTGTADVRQLSEDCRNTENDLYGCADTIDLTLHATSEWQGTMFEIGAEELTIGSWIEVECID